MACFPRPVMMRIWSHPEAIASSTPYWMMGLSTMGSISLGWALVAGRKRVPRPAAGKTALRTFFDMNVYPENEMDQGPGLRQQRPARRRGAECQPGQNRRLYAAPQPQYRGSKIDASLRRRRGGKHPIGKLI